MLISEELDRCIDYCTKKNEDMVGDQTGSHLLIENTPQDEADGDGKRIRKYTKNGFQYQRSVVMDRKSHLLKELTRKSSIIDDLLYSK